MPTKKSCPRLEIRCQSVGKGALLECKAYQAGKAPPKYRRSEDELLDLFVHPERVPDPVGELWLEEMDVGGKPSLEVSFISLGVNAKRCGVGTKLYEKALKVACKRGRRLVSDSSRTAASEGFWKKQVRKGRAVCASTAQGSGATQLTPQMDPTGKRWPCHRYSMKSPCLPGGSLAGPKRRRRK